MGSRNIVVYGFDPFADWSLNPSGILVGELAGESPLDARWNLHPLVLSTDYQDCEKALERLLHSVQPNIVLGLGLTSSRVAICLERFAVNANDSQTPDNANVVRRHQPIQKSGLPVLSTTVPLRPILASLEQAGLSAMISHHAGTYVCNHSYYTILRVAEQLETRPDCLFVHLPMIEQGELPDMPMQRHWKLDELRQAVQIALSHLVSGETAPV